MIPPGTLVQNEEKQMEKQKVSGIAYSAEEAKVTVVGLPDKPGIAARIFGVLSELNINVDMIVQSASVHLQKTDITFSLARLDLPKAVTSIANLKDELAFERLVHDDNIAKISVIGTAMRTQPGIAKCMFEVLSNKKINMQVISTSEIKISVLIQADYAELAVRSLHDAFGLDASD